MVVGEVVSFSLSLVVGVPEEWCHFFLPRDLVDVKLQSAAIAHLVLVQELSLKKHHHTHLQPHHHTLAQIQQNRYSRQSFLF
jgi:hypothetical protein